MGGTAREASRSFSRRCHRSFSVRGRLWLLHQAAGNTLSSAPGVQKRRDAQTADRRAHRDPETFDSRGDPSSFGRRGPCLCFGAGPRRKGIAASSALAHSSPDRQSAPAPGTMTDRQSAPGLLGDLRPSRHRRVQKNVATSSTYHHPLPFDNPESVVPRRAITVKDVPVFSAVPCTPKNLHRSARRHPRRECLFPWAHSAVEARARNRSCRAKARRAIRRP